MEGEGRVAVNFGPIKAKLEAALANGANVKIMLDGSVEVTINVASDVGGDISLIGGMGKSRSASVKEGVVDLKTGSRAQDGSEDLIEAAVDREVGRRHLSARG